MNNGMASDRAEVIATALERYRVQHGQYPTKLGELVPEQLVAVPRAKYTLLFHDFMYSYDPQRRAGFFGYTTLPPFGRRLYSLETQQWGSLD
jgi:hypothetical protein